MSKNEIVTAYLNGRIDRRQFVKRLTAVGVSSAAAMAYAQSLASPATASGTTRDSNGFVAARMQAYTPVPTVTGGTGEVPTATGGTGTGTGTGTDTVGTLPSTGVGESGQRGSWLAPAALAGAAAALIGGTFRKAARQTQTRD